MLEVWERSLSWEVRMGNEEKKGEATEKRKPEKDEKTEELAKKFEKAFVEGLNEDAEEHYGKEPKK